MSAVSLDLTSCAIAMGSQFRWRSLKELINAADVPG